MRFGVDAREIQNGVYTGIGHPLHNFLKFFAQNNKGDTCVLFSAVPVPYHYGPAVTNVVMAENLTLYWDQVILPRCIKGEKVDLFYSPYYKVPLAASCKVVSAIFDIMYLKFDVYRKELGLKEIYFRTVGKSYVRRADKILTCSEYSKKEIIDYYGVDPRKISVIPLSVSESYRPCENLDELNSYKRTFHIDSPYVLYMGNFKPHKNVLGLVRAFALIAGDFPELKLVLAGPLEHTYPQIVAFVETHNLTNRVIFTGKITPKDKPQLLYSGASVFAFPSLYEGFGLPPAEAMACGVAVVASNTTSIPEVVKTAGILVDPQNTDEMALSLRRLLTDDHLRNQLMAKGLQSVRDYSESVINQKLYQFFEGVLKGHG
ncbi:MAG: glycosyltransferase family 4 protein [Candidatus Omnitrophica bacterium]|nr:glycosyltransferase family 4 protein [Candidatus Omnitrophota bacterium]